MDEPNYDDSTNSKNLVIDLIKQFEVLAKKHDIKSNISLIVIVAQFASYLGTAIAVTMGLDEGTIIYALCDAIKKNTNIMKAKELEQKIKDKINEQT